ncbi:MAG: ABC transporter permease [Syntrophothermus sp.]
MLAQMSARNGMAFFRRFGMLMILVFLVAVLSVLSPRFLTLGNLMNIARQVSINGVVAAGMTVVILSGGIDLSVGSVVALTGALAAGTLAASGNPWLSMAVGLGVGALLGTINGIFIAWPKLPPFIVTLAMMALARGLTLVYTGGRPMMLDSPVYDFLGSGRLFGVPVPVVLMAAVYLGVHLLLQATKFGRYVYAIGGNEQACRLSGIRVDRIKTAVYGMGGLLAGLSGIILTARLISAQPTAGVGYELDAIAAVILGGTSLSGGEGGVGSTVVGALIIGVLANGLNLLNVSPFYQEVAKGLVILVAVILDWLIHKGVKR